VINLKNYVASIHTTKPALLPNVWRYEIVGDYGASNLSTDKNLARDRCAWYTT